MKKEEKEKGDYFIDECSFITIYFMHFVYTTVLDQFGSHNL